MTPSKIIFLTLLPVVCGAALFTACSTPTSRTGFGNGSSSGSSGSSGSDAEPIDFGDATIGSTDVALNSETSCATGTAKTSKAPVYLQIMMDGSGSMDSDGKWTSAVGAMKKIVDKYTAAPDPSFAMGLSIFSDTKDPSSEDNNNTLKYPSSIDVPMSYTDSSFKSKAYSRLNSSPESLTPILHVLQGGYNYLESYTPRSPLLPNGKKVLVLITDGAPTDDNSGTEASTLAASKASEIPLFVIGVGDFPSSDLYSYDPAYLGKLAKAGGTGPANCIPNTNQASQANKLCYFQLTPGSSTTTLTNAFVAAIDTIRGSINTCTLQIVNDPNSGEIDPTRINVVYTDPDGNQTTIVQDATDGWTYDDPSNPKNVILHGEACENSKVDGSQYDLLLGCATIQK